MSIHLPSFDNDKLKKLGRQQASWTVRAERIHDPAQKNKHDTETLEQQCLTKQLLAAIEREQKIEAEQKMLEINRYLTILERNAMKGKLEKEREDLRFSIENLTREQSREWDLNNPKALATMQPIRIDEVDEHGNVIIQSDLGLSSGQVFDGEDLARQQRIMLQYHQFKQEMTRDMKERAAKQALTKQEQNAYEKRQLAILQYLNEQEKLTEQVRRQERIQTAQENMQMAEMKQTMRTQEKQFNQQQERDHVDNFAHTRIMQEVARPGIRDEFKGFDAETVKSYNESILQQMKEAEAKKALRRQEQIEIERKELEVNRQLQINEMEQKRARMNMQRELAEEQRQNGFQHKTQELNSRETLGRNRIEENFFDNFGKHAR
ncbi:RIB43A_domain-containing protein [Hexamita inflata]|uniref:RIB43A_domain-containing protein n=1 Tax=Hexamita inflata TaxID=28002 RepID=A0ABP1H708_9EUKA